MTQKLSWAQFNKVKKTDFSRINSLYNNLEIFHFIFFFKFLSSNFLLQPPNHTFLWEGLDGTRMLTHFPPADTYNAMCDVKTLLFNVKNFKDKERSNQSLLVFGFGDGGGGPLPSMVSNLEILKDVEGIPFVDMVCK
jgi:alpha-mannosidase